MKKSVTIIICTLIATLGVVFIVLMLEVSKNMKIEEEYNGKIRVEEFKKTIIDECLEHAKSMYITKWTNTCKGMNREDLCILPSETAKQIESEYIKNMDRCYVK